jgi:hypothetical protein
MQRLASHWMGKAKARGVERLAGEIEQGCAQFARQQAGGGRDAAQVDWIADQRVALGGEMDAYLVGAAGGEAAFEQAGGAVPDAFGGVVGEGWFAAAADDRHAFAVPRVTPDGGFDLPRGGIGHAPADGEVGAVDIAGGEGGGEAREGGFGFGDDHDA